MTRRLVLTADDLGREAGSTDTIVELATQGLITATTLIPVSEHSADAAARARAAGIEPRLHVTLSSERGLPPWRPLSGATLSGATLSGATSITAPDGRLHDDPLLLGATGEAADVAVEIEAQVQWMLDHGLHPTGLDSHAGTLYGLHGRSWVTEALAVCARHSLGFRLPRHPALYFGGELPADLAAAHETAVAAADALSVRLPAAIATNRQTAAELGSYEALRDHYLRLLGALPEGTSEVFLHPAPENAVAGADSVTRVWELRLLGDPVFANAIDAEGLILAAQW